ncbi:MULTISPECIES: aminotransferase class V-fold PLP-dependent enzyme [Thiorhodovibrio]|uniref:aminotransferase class V-fold PLP-dependent enzyme n=1 Tax=Thiorhodovibrio TaxID=61593 RepID=UPI001914B0D3|nr:MULTISPECIES: aminotransferase class V-fold PLP-dependent enzyme [Thiorhodovibrio]MBK5968447.1 aminotransferase [Thiorhodovibrio winogradskyi]WPL11086.1 Isopenicillin N epimerase [Thiorhodovibrio litoralis]
MNALLSEFDLSPSLLHLNHAAIGPWPLRTRDAVCRFAEENATQGSLRYPHWQATEQRLRERLARLIGAASADDIALAKSTSEALSVIAYGLDWQPGDNIVGIAEEFPSNRIVWESLADPKHGDLGVEWRALKLAESESPEDDLLAHCDARTRMIAVSWVQYARGRRLDLQRLGQACRARGILLCVDAIQGLGAIPYDLARMPADFIVADAHKWMLGPEGIALFYCRPELRETLKLHQFGWHMVEHMGDFDRADWQPAASARRFECGSPNMLGTHAFEASLSLLEEAGLDQIELAIAERIDHLIELIDAQGFELLSPRAPEHRAGILTFRIPGLDDHQPLWRKLMEQNLLCAARGGGIRFSPHFHTPIEHLEQAVALTAERALSIRS